MELSKQDLSEEEKVPRGGRLELALEPGAEAVLGVVERQRKQRRQRERSQEQMLLGKRGCAVRYLMSHSSLQLSEE